MKYKVIELRGKEARDLTTEAMFEIASAKADGLELIRFNIHLLTDGAENLAKKNLKPVIKTLKNMKSTGQIQFFATPESFKTSSTEAVFLINKYPTLFANIDDESETDTYIYIKI